MLRRKSLNWLCSGLKCNPQSSIGRWCVLGYAAMLRSCASQNLCPQKTPPPIRVWNVLALSALATSKTNFASILRRQFSAFTLVYCTVLSTHRQIPTDVDAQDIVHEDLSSAYVSIKLWLLLAHKFEITTAEMSSDEDLTDSMIWNELWPPFENVVFSLQTSPKMGNLSARTVQLDWVELMLMNLSVQPLASSSWTSVADLFLFLHQFRCSVSMNVLLQTRVLNELRTVLRTGTKVNIPRYIYSSDCTADVTDIC